MRTTGNVLTRDPAPTGSDVRRRSLPFRAGTVALAVSLLLLGGAWYEARLHGSLIGTGDRIPYCGTDYLNPDLAYGGQTTLPWRIEKLQAYNEQGNLPALVQIGSSALFSGQPVFAAVDPQTGRLPDGSCPLDLWVQVPARGYLGYVPFTPLPGPGG